MVLLLEQLLDPQPRVVAVEGPDALVLNLGHHLLAVLRGELLRLDAERAAQGDQDCRHHARPGVAAVDVARVVREVDRKPADRGADDVELGGVRRRELARPLAADRAAGVAEHAHLLAARHAEVALGGPDAVEGVPAGLVAGHPVQAGTLEVGHGHGVALGREREHQPGLGVGQPGVVRPRVAALQRVARRALVAEGVVEAEVGDQSDVERPGRVDHRRHGRRRTALLVLGPVEQLGRRHHSLPAPGNAHVDGAGPEHRPPGHALEGRAVKAVERVLVRQRDRRLAGRGGRQRQGERHPPGQAERDEGAACEGVHGVLTVGPRRLSWSTDRRPPSDGHRFRRDCLRW